MGTGLEVGEDADLIVGSFLKFGVLFELFCFDHFDGHFLFGFNIDGFEDGGVHAPAQLMLQGVVLDHFPHS